MRRAVREPPPIGAASRLDGPLKKVRGHVAALERKAVQRPRTNTPRCRNCARSLQKVNSFCSSRIS